MNSRERFSRAMGYDAVDRVPYFEEGIRAEVVAAWRRQGLPPGADLSRLFPSDPREEIAPDLEPLPEPARWPSVPADMGDFRRRLDPEDPGRLPPEWPAQVRAWGAGDTVRMLRVHRGFFLTLRTFANARALIPSFLKAGFTCLWACEVDVAAMDYRELRAEFGRDLRLMGGIDTDALRRGRAAIRREVMEKVPPLLADGGYVPLADGRVREDVPYEHYAYYRRLLADVVGLCA